MYRYVYILVSGLIFHPVFKQLGLVDFTCKGCLRSRSLCSFPEFPWPLSYTPPPRNTAWCQCLSTGCTSRASVCPVSYGRDRSLSTPPSYRPSASCHSRHSRYEPSVATNLMEWLMRVGQLEWGIRNFLLGITQAGWTNLQL